jgi:hypothetical protein
LNAFISRHPGEGRDPDGRVELDPGFRRDDEATGEDSYFAVIPAKAGIQRLCLLPYVTLTATSLDSRLRGNDGIGPSCLIESFKESS